MLDERGDAFYRVIVKTETNNLVKQGEARPISRCDTLAVLGRCEPALRGPAEPLERLLTAGHGAEPLAVEAAEVELGPGIPALRLR